jgi:hypothetical protein
MLGTISRLGSGGLDFDDLRAEQLGKGEAKQGENEIGFSQHLRDWS